MGRRQEIKNLPASIRERLKNMARKQSIDFNRVLLLYMQIDIGFGDILKPDAILFDYPVLLGRESIKLRAYSWESVIAEKFEAIVQLSEVNSRFKDFYDIYFLSHTLNFAGSRLVLAIGETFRHRGTDLHAFTEVFRKSFATDSNRIQMWTAFQKKMRFDASLIFADVVVDIERFLSPVIEAILQNNEFTSVWNHEQGTWQ